MHAHRSPTFAVRETDVSRHQGGPIEGAPETPRTSQHYRIEGIKGVPDLGTKGNGNKVFSVLRFRRASVSACVYKIKFIQPMELFMPGWKISQILV